MTTRIKLFILVFAAFSLLGQAFAQDKNKMHKAKSGIIEYKLSGKTIGTETMYFDDHGKKEATYRKSTTKIMGTTTTEDVISLRLDSIIYDINLEEKTGVRMVIPFDPSDLTEKELEELEETGKKMMEEMGFEKTGEEKILGRNCEIWEGMGTKIWIWESLTMKTEVNLMGQWISEAVRIEIDPRIDNDKFKIPDGIEIVDAGYAFDDEDEENIQEAENSLDSLGSELGKELEKSLNDLKGILGVKKKKK